VSGGAAELEERMVFDPEMLRAMCEDDLAFEREILGEFMEAAGGSMARMATALEAGDGGEIEFAAHALKGSSRSVGAVALGDACEALEDLAAARDLAGAAAAVERVQGEYRRLLPRLIDHLQSIDPAA
jgi:HPt (histidine-containing phosphotransfer) domain-containing protein